MIAGAQLAPHFADEAGIIPVLCTFIYARAHASIWIELKQKQVINVFKI